MIKDRQARRLWKYLAAGMPLWKAALKSGMDEKTARKYRETRKLPSETAPVHTWRTRPDPFQDVWTEVFEQLELNRIGLGCGRGFLAGTPIGYWP